MHKSAPFTSGCLSKLPLSANVTRDIREGKHGAHIRLFWEKSDVGVCENYLLRLIRLWLK